MKVRAQEKHVPTMYRKLNTGWTRVHPKSPSKRRRRVIARQKRKAANIAKS